MRYLHKAIAVAELDLNRYYSIDDLTEVLLKTGEVPVKRTTLQRNLRNFVRRNVTEPNRTRVKGRFFYLGAALRLPVPYLYPRTIDEVETIRQQSAEMPKSKLSQSEISEDEKVVDQVDKKNEKMKIFSFALMISSLLLLIVGWSTTQFLKYIRSGPKATIENYKQSKHLSYEEQYHLAEAYFDAGEFEEATRYAYQLLSMRNIPPHLAGHAHFIIAKVESRKGNYENALGQANIAKKIYRNLPESRSGSLRGVETLVSTIFIQTEQYEMALSKLLPLFSNEHTSSYKAYIGLLCGEASFWMKNYEDALFWNKEAFREYENASDQMGLTNALVNRAWLRVVTGDLYLASSDLERAEALIEELGNTSMIPLVTLTRSFLDKCLGKPVTLDESRKITDPHFLRYVDFVESHSCIPFRIVGHNPPPQGGNDKPPVSQEEGNSTRNGPKRIGPDTPPPQGGDDPPPR